MGWEWVEWGDMTGIALTWMASQILDIVMFVDLHFAPISQEKQYTRVILEGGTETDIMIQPNYVNVFSKEYSLSSACLNYSV